MPQLTHTITFNQLKATFQKHFSQLTSGTGHLFNSSVSKTALWETYIKSFPAHLQQEHTCSCCRHFIKNYGGLVIIKDNQMHSIWGISQLGDPIYQGVMDKLNALVLQHPIADPFITKRHQLGTNSNFDLRPNKPHVKWEHFYLELPSKFISSSAYSVERQVGELRQTKQVFQRGLEEFPISSTQAILELIDQGSLYRGEEFKGTLQKFLQLQREYAQLNGEEAKDIYSWSNFQAAAAVAKIRNSAIGTLLIDISAGMELDLAVTRFERVMAPANYKRPKPVVTAKMIEEAEQRLAELGLTQSLGRRHATMHDITVKNVLYVDRQSSQRLASANPFDELKQGLPVNPRGFKKVQEITLADFISNVLPTAQGLKVLLENRHAPNLVSLIAPINPDSPSLFKWDNGYSWCYEGSLADSDIKQRVKAAGGQVSGALRISLGWHTYADLDLHVHGPLGTHIYYGNKRSGGGMLDVDMNAGYQMSKEPVENVIFGDYPVEGVYQVKVHNFTNREMTDRFSVEVECMGEVLTFDYGQIISNKEFINVVTFRYSRANGIEVVKSIDSSAAISCKTLWNMKTNQFQEVEMVMYSPNHWDDSSQTGNKHVFFMLKGAHNPGPVRGMFNEFLKQDLHQNHKRVFEALGGKMQVQDSDTQLSGLGFSTTSEGHFFVEVMGATKRILKVTV